VHRVAKPPELDGKRDDPCWLEATATGDFELFKGAGAPKNRTRAWAAYDADCLYLFFECSDQDMAKVQGKRPQDTIDEDIWQEEEIEIFFDVNHDRKTYYQLMCSVLGTKCDMASQVGNDWNGGRDELQGGWRAKTTRDEKAWYAEIAIPFTVLTRTGELAATPQPGTVWGANFYRHEYRENEWINWNVATKGFHQPTRFGELLFLGFRDRKSPVVEKLELGELEFGTHAVQCRVTNPGAAPLAVTAAVRVARKENRKTKPKQQAIRVAAGATEEITFPYTIVSGGEWQATVRVEAAGELLLVGRATRRLPRIRQDLKELSSASRDGIAALRKSRFPEATKIALHSRLSSFRQESDRLGSLLRKPKKLAANQWTEIRRDVTKLKQQSRETVRQLSYVAADRAQSGAGAKQGFLLAVHGPLEHVFTDTTSGNRPNRPVKLTAMAGEGESFQVAVMALWADLPEVEVVATPLSGSGTLGQGAVEVFLVAYQKSVPRPNDPPGIREWFPDVLLPNVPRRIPAYMTQPYWIDINVPRDTQPGLYRGAVTVTVPGKGAQSIPVELTVRDAMLPKVCQLDNDFWITTHGPRWWKYDTRSLDGMAEPMRLAGKNHISAMPAFWIELYFKVKIRRTDTERYTFDFTEYNQFLLLAKKHGVSSWNPNHECNQGWASYFAGGYGAVNVTDAKTGEEYEFANRYKKKTIPLEELWTNTPMFEQFWKAYVPNLKSIGMLEEAWYESVDEPNDTPRIELLLMIHKQLQKWAPELKLMSWGTYPAHHYARARGYVDAWAPQLGKYWEVRDIMQRDQKENGITQKVYTCGGQRRNDAGGYTPDGHIRDPNITRRLVPWMCYKWDIRGYLFYAMNPWPHLSKKDEIIPAEDQPWPTVDQLQKQPVFNLLMPGPDKTFLQTIRLKAFRDGMEDYDYLKSLELLTAELRRAGGHRRLLRKADRVLEIGDDIVADPYTYTFDP
ncbi:MAG: DUF4091 domain-containing protein, partial [Lentisphaeria bacterium]|nr:DUF4091 domain-containing protein [Lentisphaeria bacterium]